MIEEPSAPRTEGDFPPPPERAAGEHDVQAVLERSVRERPVHVLLAAFALGLVMGRMIR
ncbi:MAG: hypothetical protein ACREKN_01695 [Longimicrobiaceae bacterium]